MSYIAFVAIWMPFPGSLPIDRLNLNYAGPILSGVILLCWIGVWMVGDVSEYLPLSVVRNTTPSLSMRPVLYEDGSIRVRFDTTNPQSDLSCSYRSN